MEENYSVDSTFSWTAFYMEFADKLLFFKERRSELLSILEEVYSSLNLKNPFTDQGGLIDDICPFTVIGSFNKGITTENRIAIAKEISSRIGVTTSVPTEFEGIPVLNNMNAWFFRYKAERESNDIDNLWAVYEAGIQLANHQSEDNKNNFIYHFDIVGKQYGVKWKLTMGLYWIRPFFYLNLDQRNRIYILNTDSNYSEVAKISTLKDLPSAVEYLELLDYLQDGFNKRVLPHRSFPELSQAAWLSPDPERKELKQSKASFLKWFAPIINALKKLGGSGTPGSVRDQIRSDLNLSDDVVREARGKNEVNKFENEVAFARSYLVREGFIDNSAHGIWSLTDKGNQAELNEKIASDIFKKWSEGMKEDRGSQSTPASDVVNKSEKKYWIYSPGHNAAMWDVFYSEGIMGIGWKEMGDLRNYSSKEEMKIRMKELYGEEYTYMNDAHATWQFANELVPGDIIYVKKGRTKVIGYGVVESEYMYDTNREGFNHIHKVNWRQKGEWPHPGKAVNKTLTDITPYIDYVESLNELLIEETEDVVEEREEVYESYTAADFLDDVFLDEHAYQELTTILKMKNNLILQGAPGVGKTYCAKRLAYSMMEKKDKSRVKMIQFHQSYSYEDFIMGYRPKDNGFELAEGPFYEFCKKAEVDSNRDYYFIIDEINRGNLSQIFGELLMLIEKDKRGQELRLMYKNELFSVPKNVYIIGMMNTADRSLAMIDYALRRRFAFYTLKPSFDSKGFQKIVSKADNERLNTLIEQIKVLNEDISQDESLGSGFKIGHSYLCDNEDITDEWLSLVVEYQLLPLLEEYWFDEPDKINEWKRKLRGVLSV